MWGSSEGPAEVGDHEYAGAPTCETVVFPSSTQQSTSAEKAGTPIQG